MERRTDVISTAITCYELMIRIDWIWENWTEALLLFVCCCLIEEVFLGVITFRKSESIQLHCIAKLAKSYSFLASFVFFGRLDFFCALRCS